MPFKSGFAWIKVNGYSHICKIINRNTDGTFDCEVGNVIFRNVPFEELTCVNGDE